MATSDYIPIYGVDQISMRGRTCEKPSIIKDIELLDYPGEVVEEAYNIYLCMNKVETKCERRKILMVYIIYHALVELARRKDILDRNDRNPRQMVSYPIDHNIIGARVGIKGKAAKTMDKKFSPEVTGLRFRHYHIYPSMSLAAMLMRMNLTSEQCETAMGICRKYERDYRLYNMNPCSVAAGFLRYYCLLISDNRKFGDFSEIALISKGNIDTGYKAVCEVVNDPSGYCEVYT